MGGTDGRLAEELDEARRRIAELTAVLERQQGPQRQADGAPLSGHQLFEGLFENDRIPLAVLDPDLNLVRVNRAYAALGGGAPAAWAGRNLFADRPDPEAEALFRRVVETGEPHVAVAARARFADAAGRPAGWWDWTLTPHKGPDGRVVRLTLMLVDVTERVRATEAVAEREARYRGLAETVQVGVFRADAGGRCVYANGRLGALAGRPSDDFLGDGWRSCIHPDDRQRVAAAWAEAVAAGRPFSDEFRLGGPRGEPVWVYVQAVREPSGNGGEPGWVGCVTDITGQRTVGEALNALASSSGRDLDAFLKVCARQLARVYGARYGLVGLIDPSGERVQTRAVWAGDAFAPDFAYDLATAPCRNLLEGERVLIREGVAARYPDAPVVRELKVDGYLGHPLTDAAGQVVGVAVVMDTGPLALSPWTEPILGGFARRISAEVERHRTEERLAQSERSLARAQQIGGFGHWAWDVVTGALEWSDETYRIFGVPPDAPPTYQLFLEAIHPRDRDRVQAAVVAATDPDRRAPYAVDHRLLRPDGEVRIVHCQGEVTFDPATGRALHVIGTVQDITVQRRAQEALATLASSSAADLQSFLDDSARHLARAYGAHFGFVGVLDGEGAQRIHTLTLWAGDHFAPNLTYDLPGTPCADIIAGKLSLVPDRMPERYPNDAELAELGVVSYFGAPLTGADGRPLGLVSVMDTRPMAPPAWTEPILGSFARRISAELERNRSEQVRQRSEAEMAAILANLQDIYARTDLNGVITRASGALESRLGYRPEEVVGTRLADLYADPEGRARYLEALEASGGRVHNFETRLRARDGHTIWVSINGQYLRDAEGRVIGTEGTARDITEGRRMAEALRESKARLAEAQAIAHLGSWEWDPAGAAMTWSDETYRIYGLPAPPEAEGPVPLARFVAAVHPEDRERVERALAACAAEGTALREDHRIGRPDGTVRVVRQLALAQDASGGCRRVLGAVQDITDLARAEADRERFHAQLLQAQKMEAVGLLAGGVAHDFNNLLTTITGYTDLALSRAAELPGPLAGELAEVRTAAERATSLTRQLLLFSRRQPMAFRNVDLAERVDPLLTMLGRVIGEQVEVHTDVAPGLWAVRGDGMSIDQLVTNLAINARDAMPEGGRLSVEIGNVTVSEAEAGADPEARPGRFVRIRVRDTGVGMDAATLAHVFEPFFTTKEPGRGTGLGMSVAHGIVKQHGGWIRVESAPGRGSTFEVFLPATDAAASEPRRPTVPEAAPGAGRRVLVVEDEDALRDFARIALTGQGYQVSVAATADEALEVFEREGGAFSLVFSDVVLPDRSGVKLVEELRGRRPDLKVLLSSGYPDPHMGWSAIEDRGLPFIQKPYTLPRLLAEIGEQIGGPSGGQPGRQTAGPAPGEADPPPPS